MAPSEGQLNVDPYNLVYSLMLPRLVSIQYQALGKQKTQLLLGWATHGAKAMSVEVKVIELPVGIRWQAWL